MTDNTSFVKYLIIGAIIIVFALPVIAAWLDWRDERREEEKNK